MDATFFETPAEFRAWLERNHETATELWVGFYKKASGKPSMRWPEAVDEALCFGWIDGIRKSIDGESYRNRFTPRQKRSTWSAVNIARVKELTKQGRMHPAGVAAFEARADERSAIYSYEQRHSSSLDAAQEARLRANENAWEFFQAQPPSYRKAVAWWIASAKKEETRERRFASLLEHSEQGRRVPPLASG